ncbi:gliding motility-associated C-terminal domain-containing protein [Aurantibacillus circumpalustris]|uniref:T9SS type B sorting domain-containing protein n=1 Tax=Aurantibacillus circumpalustris TaxID=3036359 RepID=UPI00295BE193|nr:gliding motility-associated C-terminal domain-containing protein [Aurantibacillus circumpalustris]
MVILDQWNQLVFSKEAYNNEWDGKNMGGEILPDATYYYILTFPESNKKYTGFITLLRNK